MLYRILIGLLITSAVACTADATDQVMATRTEIAGTVSLGSSAGLGELVLQDGCVLFVGQDGRVLLPVWPDTTTWDSETQVVAFKRIDSELTPVQLGIDIRLGGASMEGSEPPGLLIPEACNDRGEAFVVSGVTVD